MSKDKTELAKPADQSRGLSLLSSKNENSMVPSYMQDMGQEGTDLLTQFVVPPRIKTIQNQRGDAYKEFEPGDVVLTPSNIVLAKKDEPFYLIPLLFFPEWAVVNPYEMKASLRMIRERTYDVTSEIARKARDEKLRKSEVCPDDIAFQAAGRSQYRLSYVEYLVFICAVAQKEGLAGQPVLLSYARGEHRNGSNLAMMIKNRHAPIFGCVFEFKTGKLRSNQHGSWYGIDASNPTSKDCPPPFVPETDILQLKELHEKFKEAYLGGLLKDADLGEDDAAETANAGSGKF